MSASTVYRVERLLTTIAKSCSRLGVAEECQDFSVIYFFSAAMGELPQRSLPHPPASGGWRIGTVFGVLHMNFHTEGGQWKMLCC